MTVDKCCYICEYLRIVVKGRKLAKETGARARERPWDKVVGNIWRAGGRTATDRLVVDVPSLCGRTISVGTERVPERAGRPFRHLRPFMVTAAGPSMPQAQSLKYHHVPTMMAMIKAKKIVFVRCVKRRDLKMKWSKRTPDIKTENHRVGSCRVGRFRQLNACRKNST
mgnify:FL=1